jgi:superfamily II DNA or RNA helicase
MTSAVTLRFEGGTLVVRGLAEPAPEAPPHCAHDPRLGAYRAPAHAYRSVVTWLKRSQIDFADEARSYEEIDLVRRVRRDPFPHQREALDAWVGAGGTGLVVLPTGSGKTQLAVLAMESRRRSALVVVPTLDLMNQWYDILRSTFGCAVGLVGGGYHEILPLTVTTYDSAHLHMERFGHRFGLVVFDECHHLPSEAYATAARMCLAPYRLGLTATPERNDGREIAYEELIGPTVYRRDIHELVGSYLAPYDTVRLEVDLTPEERAAYERDRSQYIGYVRSQGIRMGAPDGWSQFLQRASMSRAGREAFEAYRRQRMLALAAPAKLDVLERLLHTHRAEQTIVFTEDNATVYAISRRLLLPAITHQTKVKERSAILGGLAEGRFVAVVTSKVLNEGVDVPSASVAIVLSGSGSVREHVQRLGRILRKSGDKRATLYELVASGTAEENTSQKRREHVAYR